MGMISLLEEFNATVAGIAVLVESEKIEERLVDEYLSIVQLSDVDVKEKRINVNEGNYFKGEMNMKVVQTNQAPAAIGPYSQGIIVNNLFFSSGQIPLTAEGTMVAGDIKEQTHQVFQNLKAVLAEAGASLETVIKATVFIKSMDDFADC